MDMVNEIIKKRKSIRQYDAKGTVTDEQLKTILEAGMLAPSACNLRPWEFIVVKNRLKLDQIVEFHRFAKMITAAQAAVIVVAKPDVQKGKPGDGMWQHDCGAAVQNILLQATEMGLGTCWCGLHPNESYMQKTRDLFSIAKSDVPFCVIAVGVPAEEFGSRGFYEESKVTWVN